MAMIAVIFAIVCSAMADSETRPKKYALIDGKTALTFTDDRLIIEFDAFEMHHRMLLRRAVEDDNDEMVKREAARSSNVYIIRPLLFRRRDGVKDRVRANMGRGMLDRRID